MTDRPDNGVQEFALIVRKKGKPQALLVRYLTLLLNYRYGLDIIAVDKFVAAFSVIQKYREQIRCTFVIQDQRIGSRSSIAPLNLEGAIPLFLLLPKVLLEEHQLLCHRMENVHFCAWETAFSHAGQSLPKMIAEVFAEQGIGDLVSEVQGLPPEESEQRIEHRLAHLHTLPTLPEIALRIMRLVEDPQSTVEEMEEVLMRDPAIVHKLLQVVSSPAFAGTSHRDHWTLPEAIVRLGRKQIGAIALQIKLMNSLVRPEESQFNLHRFWRHSVGCALIADRLCQDQHLRLPPGFSFDDYWIGALLHDLGKLILGFFFWPHFEEVVEKMGDRAFSFREAEIELGDLANHEFLGKVLLQRSKVGKSLIEAVGAHHTLGETPEPLVCLVHLADNVAKELGMGYLEQEKTVYSGLALRTLGLERERVANLTASLGAPLVQEIDELVERCLANP